MMFIRVDQDPLLIPNINKDVERKPGVPAGDLYLVPAEAVARYEAALAAFTDAMYALDEHLTPERKIREYDVICETEEEAAEALDRLRQRLT